MKPLRLLLAAFTALWCLTGCFQVEKTVELKPDGSGTVEEKVIVSKAAFANIQQMAAGFGGDKAAAAAAKPPDLYDEAKLKAAAAQMGPGVTFVSAQRISTDAGDGFTATYAFTDINKLTLDQNPGEGVPAGEGISASSKKKEPIVFHFAKGNPAVLTLKMPPPDFKAKKEQSSGMDDMAMQAMKQIFKDVRIVMTIEVQGAIQETNAENHDGSRVTLMDVDFNKVVADPEKFKALAKANPQTLQEAKTLIKGLDGVKIETAPEVTIKFQ